jgi:GntR family transcriptional regulator/MocR family aminotransferase
MLLHALQLDHHSSTPLYKQIMDYIKQEIHQGRLSAGAKLPSIRSLAAALQVSRITVENAYGLLLEQGYLLSKPQAGYFAADLKDIQPFLPLPMAAPVEPEPRYNFRSNWVDSQSFNLSLWRRYVNQALQAKELLTSYGHAQGEPALRYTLAKYSYESRDVKCTPEQIVVGAGIQSLLHILCGIIKPSISTIGVQYPGFFHAEQIFKDHGFLTIPFNIDTLSLNSTSSAGKNPGLVCVNPSNPYGGKALPANKRIELLKWSQHNQTYILEDDYIGEFRYLSRPIPSLQGMSQGQQVIYLGSFSRTLLPSLRISYMVLPPALLPIYQQISDRYNQTSSSMEQLALNGFIADGQLSRHIKRLRKVYAHKNQILRSSLQQVFGKKVTITNYESGLRLLLLVDSPHSSQTLSQKASQHGLAIIPVAPTPADQAVLAKEKRPVRPQIMLSYAGISESDILPAVKALYQAWFG